MNKATRLKIIVTKNLSMRKLMIQTTKLLIATIAT